MDIILSHESALRYWLTKTADECIPDSTSACSPASATANMRDIKRAPLPFDFSEERPLNVLVGTRAQSRNQLRVRPHRWSGPLPNNSFCELAGPCAVSSPELTLVQMASRSSLLSTIVLGCYLCGSFAIGDDGRGYTGQRTPLTSPDSIRSFVDAMPGAPGTRRVIDSLRYVVPHTASPKEVQLAVACSLPARLGGWGFPAVVANQEIRVPEHLLAFAGTYHFFGDLFFAEVNGDLEFDSVEFHTGAHRLDHTLMRRNVLEAAGILTISATEGQICTFERYSTFMAMARERFGMPALRLSTREIRRQEEVYEYLEDASRRFF